MSHSTRPAKSKASRAASSSAAGSATAGFATPGRSAKKIRPRWWRWALFAIVLAAAIAAISSAGFDWAALQDRIAGLNAALVLVLMALLPVGGFSVGIIYLVAGAKFGPLWGGVAVAGTTAIHLLLTHWISRSFLREPLLRFLARREHRLPVIPPGENIAISVMAALVPGVPYFARNYLLALSGVPLRTYFWICLPIYVARSYVTIFLGDLSGDPNRRDFIILVAVYAVKLGICAYLIARLRRRYKLGRHPGEKAAKSPASAHQHVA